MHQHSLTLSGADLQWPDLFNLLTQGKKELHTLSSSDKWKLMRENPIPVANQFNRRKQAFLKYILKGKYKPLGEIENCFLRIEFQMRGSPNFVPRAMPVRRLRLALALGK